MSDPNREQEGETQGLEDGANSTLDNLSQTENVTQNPTTRPTASAINEELQINDDFLTAHDGNTGNPHEDERLSSASNPCKDMVKETPETKASKWASRELKNLQSVNEPGWSEDQGIQSRRRSRITLPTLKSRYIVNMERAEEILGNFPTQRQAFMSSSIFL